MKLTREDARLIALDWGTSSLRAYLIGTAGSILEEQSLDMGVMRVHDVAPNPTSRCRLPLKQRFELACGQWLQILTQPPVIASGMVGSAQGWCEAPYLDTPMDTRDLCHSLVEVQSSRGMRVHIVPGLIRRAGLVNVMRGEETQIVGRALSSCRYPRCPLDRHARNLTPNGSLSVERAFQDFETFMTGEVYAALSEHNDPGVAR